MSTVAFLALAMTAGAEPLKVPPDLRDLAVEAVNSAPEFHVRVAVDRPGRVYREGETLTATVRSSVEGHLYLFYVDASGRVSCVFPNKVQSDNRIPAGKDVTVPAPGAEFRFRVLRPLGREVLKAVVTREPLAGFKAADLAEKDVTPVAGDKFRELLRDLGAKGKEPVRWAEHSVEILTLAKAESVNPPAAQQPVEPQARRVGLFVGLSEWKDPKMPPLKVSHHDAAELAKVLKERCKFDEVEVLQNERATLAAVEERICRRLPAATRPGDVVVIFWSGHGGRMTAEGGTGHEEYLVPFDAESGSADAVRRSQLTDRRFARWVQALDGRKVVVILDACHSGGIAADAKGIGGGDAKADGVFFARAFDALKDIGQKEAAVLASSRAGESSYEWREKGLSVMTYFLVSRLRDGTGSITLRDGFDYVREKVPPAVQQLNSKFSQTPVLMDTTTPPLLLRP